MQLHLPMSTPSDRLRTITDNRAWRRRQLHAQWWFREMRKAADTPRKPTPRS